MRVTIEVYAYFQLVILIHSKFISMTEAKVYFLEGVVPSAFIVRRSPDHERFENIAESRLQVESLDSLRYPNRQKVSDISAYGDTR